MFWMNHLLVYIPGNNHRLLKTLKTLRDIGNSIIVVEHDRETMKASDYIIDLGPGAGKSGGNVIYAGVPKKLLSVKKSLTGQYLSGKKEIKTQNYERNAQSGLLNSKRCHRE